MTFDDRVRIQKEVVMRVIPPEAESNEQTMYRAAILEDYKKALETGTVLSFPSDWE